jgi:hypothetical protein
MAESERPSRCVQRWTEGNYIYGHLRLYGAESTYDLNYAVAVESSRDSYSQ